MHLFRHAHNPTGHPENCLVQGPVLTKHLEIHGMDLHGILMLYNFMKDYRASVIQTGQI
jgi:hypothetical protein